jgi:transposase
LDAFVETLDIKALGFKNGTLKDTGRPSYHPGDLLRLYIYGYLNRIRSSRMLEREAHRNVEVMWHNAALTEVSFLLNSEFV